MPRARLIKPEFFASEQIAKAGEGPAMLFIGLLVHCDDNGIIPAKPYTIARQTVGAWGITGEEVERRAAVLESLGLIESYSVDSVPYWRITGFGRHQKLHKPSYRYPLPPPEKTGESPKSPPGPHRAPEQKTEDRRQKGEVKPEVLLTPNARVRSRTSPEDVVGAYNLGAGQTLRYSSGVWEACDRILLTGADADLIQRVAAYYRGALRDCVPSFRSFARSFDEWRSRMEGDKGRIGGRTDEALAAGEGALDILLRRRKG